MADYSPIRDAFRDLNKMVLDKQVWDAQHEQNVQRSERQDKLLDSQLQDQALKRQGLQLQADKAAYQMEEVGINRDDLINPENPQMVQFFDDNQEDIARSFGGDGSSFQDGILVNGEGSPFMQARHRYNPAKISYMYRVSSDINPIAEEQEKVSSLYASRQGILDDKADFIKNTPANMQQKGLAEFKIQENRLNSDIIKSEQGKLNNKAWKRKVLMNKRSALNETLGEVLAIGADPDQAYAAHKNAMNDVAYQLELIEKGEKKATAMERGYIGYLSSKGLTEDEYPLHQYKNEQWDKDDGKSSDYKFHRQMVLDEFHRAVDNTPAGTEAPKRPTEQEIRKSYTNSSNSALTVNQAAKNINLWLWDNNETLAKAGEALGVNRSINSNDLLKATVDLASQPGMDMTKAQVAVLGAMDEGNFEVLNGDYSSIMASDPAQSNAAPSLKVDHAPVLRALENQRSAKGMKEGSGATVNGSRYIVKGSRRRRRNS